MRLFVLSGMIFVAGAIGLEMLNGDLHSEGKADTLRYSLQSGMEEFCELIGASLFLYAVLDVLDRRGVRVHVNVASSATGAPRSAHTTGTTSPRATRI
jgi:hypothetical protein